MTTLLDVLKGLLDEYKKNNVQPEYIQVGLDHYDEIVKSGIINTQKIIKSNELGHSRIRILPPLEPPMFSPNEHKLVFTMKDGKVFSISNVFPDRKDQYKFLKTDENGFVLISFSKFSYRRKLGNQIEFDYAQDALDNQRWCNLGYRIGIPSIHLNQITIVKEYCIRGNYEHNVEELNTVGQTHLTSKLALQENFPN